LKTNNIAARYREVIYGQLLRDEALIKIPISLAFLSMLFDATYRLIQMFLSNL
jgi:hypothetical protein